MFLLRTLTNCYFYYQLNFTNLNLSEINDNNRKLTHDTNNSARRNNCRSDITCNVGSNVRFIETGSVDNVQNNLIGFFIEVPHQVK